MLAMDGVTHVRLNAHAGSLTIHYDPARRNHVELLGALRDLGCSEASVPSPAFAHKAGTLFGKALVGAVVNKAVERSAFKLVSVLL
jgi:Zn-dependent membrane protease YugP